MMGLVRHVIELREVAIVEHGGGGNRMFFYPVPSHRVVGIEEEQVRGGFVFEIHRQERTAGITAIGARLLGDTPTLLA